MRSGTVMICTVQNCRRKAKRCQEKKMQSNERNGAEKTATKGNGKATSSNEQLLRRASVETECEARQRHSEAAVCGELHQN